jgi:hypothetical protein
MVHPAMYVSLVRKGDSVTGAQNIDVPSQAAGQQAARHDHVTAVTGVWGGGGGATAQVACMAPHLCVSHSSQ